jgi:hypothetical protein
MLPTHAMQRSLERCPGVCPGVLLRFLKASVLSGDDHSVRFVGRVRREEFLDLYFFRLANGLPRYALICTPSGFVVTILEPGKPVWTARGHFNLGEDGLEAIPNNNSDERGAGK